MQLTLDQALAQAINAHKAGKLQDAERLYRAILQTAPQHPDANHNLGVLAVSIGKVSEALPYLKTALEAKNNQGQFWLSYLNALMVANQINEARKIFELGKNIELCGVPTKHIEQRLTELERGLNRNQATPTIQAPTQQQINDLIASYNSGNLELTELHAKLFTQNHPNHPFGWKVLGATYKRRGSLDKSLNPMRQSVCLAPSDSEAHNNLGVTLFDLGHLGEAEASFREAIRLKPDYPEALSNLGNILKDFGRLTDAEANFREAIRLKPDYPEAHSNLGITLYDLGRLTEAEASFREAIHLKPDYAEARSNLGNALKELGRLTEAETSFREAVRLMPNLAEAHSNLGVTLNELGRLSEAEISLREAIRLKPNLAEPYYNLAVTLKELGRLTEAEASYREAIRLKSDYAEAHNNLGNTLSNLGRLSEAEVSYREAIRLKPKFVEAHSNLLFSLNYVESLPPEEAWFEAQRYGSIVSSQSKPKFSSWPICSKSTKLRIGFVSGDFNNHPVGYFMEGLIKHLDQNQFELYAFPTTSKQDELTCLFNSRFNHWIPIYGRTDQEAASVIYNQGIHILIDLSGHTAHNRLPVFSYKPAPVQISWLGYFATTGLPEMDFFLGDPIMSPPNEQLYFTERLLRLKETWLCLTPPKLAVSLSSLPALTNNYITFGCFGNLSKMNNQVVTTWSTILHQVPNSKLFLKSKQLSDPSAVKDVQNRFGSNGIHTSRLILEGPTSRTDYFEKYNRIDMVLDTFPYPGGTTSVDAYWMGVPVLTVKGDRFLSRLGESIATNAGQSNWVAQDIRGYVNKAVELSGQLDELSRLRETLREDVLESPIFKVEQFSKNFADALQEAWGAFKN